MIEPGERINQGQEDLVRNGAIFRVFSEDALRTASLLVIARRLTGIENLLASLGNDGIHELIQNATVLSRAMLERPKRKTKPKRRKRK